MGENEINPTPDPHSPTGIYIPSDIQDCFRELDKILSGNVLKQIRTSEEAGLFRYHFGLGAWIRNNWGLWIEESRRKQYFDNLGVNDADDASSLIITSYWHYLNGIPIEFPKQIAYHKIEWSAIKSEPKTGNLS
jgi:hypothetical protein